MVVQNVKIEGEKNWIGIGQRENSLLTNLSEVSANRMEAPELQ